MEEFKGTPGNWIKDAHLIRATDGTNIADVWDMGRKNFPNEIEGKANQNLIAAAPELLEALQAYLNAGCKETRRAASIKAKAAINKALNIEIK